MMLPKPVTVPTADAGAAPVPPEPTSPAPPQLAINATQHNQATPWANRWIKRNGDMRYS